MTDAWQRISGLVPFFIPSGRLPMSLQRSDLRIINKCFFLQAPPFLAVFVVLSLCYYPV